MRVWNQRTWVSMCASVFVLGACDDDGGDSGTVQVFAEAEDSIPLGLLPGTGDEDIVDGWTVTYDAFLISLGDFRASRSADPSDVLADTGASIVDLRNLPSGGVVLARFEDVTATRWDKVGYSILRAEAGMSKAEGLSQSDYDFMVANSYSVYVRGVMTNPTGQSCLPTAPTDCVPATEIRFELPLRAATRFDDCAPEEGDAGFAVPTGGTAQVKPTIHGDHWFFNNITQGQEITVRRAQWIANADLDRDGDVGLEELAQSEAADLFPAALYNLSGALIPIATGADFINAQAHTLGDFQGEGECPTRTIIDE